MNNTTSTRPSCPTASSPLLTLLLVLLILPWPALTLAVLMGGGKALREPISDRHPN